MGVTEDGGRAGRVGGAGSAAAGEGRGGEEEEEEVEGGEGVIIDFTLLSMNVINWSLPTQAHDGHTMQTGAYTHTWCTRAH